MFTEYLLGDEFSLNIFLNSIQELYILLIRSSYNKEAINDMHHITGQIISILQFIKTNYNNLNLTKLADEFHYHPAYMSRFIRKQTGRNFSQILISARIDEAKKLLKIHSDWRILKIGRAVGYSNEEYFITIFKKATGETPYQYRKKYLKSQSRRYRA